MVPIKTCSDIPIIQQVCSGDICGPERVGDKFTKEGSSVHKQEEREIAIRFGRDNVLLKQVTDKKVVVY